MERVVGRRESEEVGGMGCLLELEALEREEAGRKKQQWKEREGGGGGGGRGAN
jgi:hypothetical protein